MNIFVKPITVGPAVHRAVIVRLGPADIMTPELLDRIAGTSYNEGIRRMVVYWRLRCDPPRDAKFPIDLSDIAGDPRKVLVAMARAMVRSARKMGLPPGVLPDQFFTEAEGG